MNRLILDTSVVIKWFSSCDENDLENALRLRDDIVSGRCQAIIPGLLIYEMANALHFNPYFEAGDVKAAVESLFDMDLTIRQAGKELAGRAIEIARQYEATVYDACFLALAEMEKGVLITADYRFASKVQNCLFIIRLDQWAASR